MFRAHRMVSMSLVAVIAFGLGVAVRSAVPTAAAMMAPRPVVMHLSSAFSGPMQAVVPDSVWIAPLAESATADAVAVKISTVRLHRHKVPNEFIYVVSGSARVQVGSTKTVVHPGDFIFIPAGVAHSIASIGAPIQLLGFEAPKPSPTDMQYVK